MNKTISFLRIALLLTLFTAGLILLCGEEQDLDLATWTLHFLIDKSLCALSFLSFGLLYKRWSKTDHWIIAYNKWCEKGLDSPNPMAWEDEGE